MTIELTTTDIHFFYTLVEEARDPLLLRRYRSVITAEEMAKAERFIFAADRHRSLVTRALLRYTLSSSTNLPADEFEFTKNSYGKPALKEELTPLPVEFNISHSSGVTACALTLGNEVGIDVEDYTRKFDPSLADRFFTPTEAAYLRRCPADPKKTFFDFWTLKESYIKATGKGLSTGLDSFGFILHPEIRIFFEKAVNETPEDWMFFTFSPVKNYTAAVAVHSPRQKEKLKLHVYKCIPFGEIELQDSLNCKEVRNQALRL